MHQPGDLDRTVKKLHAVLTWLGLGLVLLASPASAQETSSSFKPEELDQLVAPIALHPDPLLAQILMASTYPLEIVQAARFVKDNPKLQGDQLNEALKKFTWDDSVKSMVFFPQVLAMMNEKLDWLQKLGDAFLGQQQELMAAVQRLRARAQAAGQLTSTPEQKVTAEPAAAAPTSPPSAGTPAPGAPPWGQAPSAQTAAEVTQAPPTVIRIEPTNPQVVYVPSYNPTVVYGAWPYPAYPPYYPYPAGYFAAGAFTFAAGMAVGAAVWGDCDWHRGGGEININNSKVNNFTANVNNRAEATKRVEQYSRGGAQAGQARGQWQHDPEHRKGVQYRDTATQQRFNKSGPPNTQAREDFRGRERQGGAGPQPSASPRTGAQGGAGQARQAGAFEGMGSGRDAQSFSNRGNASRQSFNASTAGPSRGAGGGRAGGGGGRGGGGRR
ncbi:MAG TPA: DUF3300 domain-containing protein [Methylomirabilota bacterium]